MSRMKEADVIPAVLEALRTATNMFKKWIEKQGLNLKLKMMQKPCLLETAKILRKVLDKR